MTLSQILDGGATPRSEKLRLPSASFPASVFHLFMGLLASVVEGAEPFVEWEEQHPVAHFEVLVVQIVEVVAY